eukprot:765795-Hanusia_phi.AAC.1
MWWEHDDYWEDDSEKQGRDCCLGLNSLDRVENPAGEVERRKQCHVSKVAAKRKLIPIIMSDDPSTFRMFQLNVCRPNSL